MGKQEHDGGCLCGGVRYRATGALRDVIACHCGQCRRITGHYGAFSACPREDLHLVSAETLAWYESSPGIRRGFCSRCGATLFWDNPKRNFISLAAGSLDQPSGVKLVAHIFVADAADYYTIDDDLPHYRGTMA